MHCLPVHRGEEVIAEIIDGPQSGGWGEAKNSDAHNAEAATRRRAERRALEAAQQAANPRRDMGFREWLDDHFKNG